MEKQIADIFGRRMYSGSDPIIWQDSSTVGKAATENDWEIFDSIPGQECKILHGDRSRYP